MRWKCFSFLALMALFLGCSVKADQPLPVQAWLGLADQAGGEMAAVVGGEVIYLAQGRRILVIAEDDDGDLALVHTSDMLGGAVTALGRVGEFLVAGWRSAEGQGHLSWYSLSDPTHPQWRHDYIYNPGEPGRPSDIAAVGTTLYLTDLPDGPEFPPGWLFVIDVADPLAPVVHEQMEFGGQNPKLTVWNEEYLLRSSTTPVALGVGVIDISDPLAPDVVGGYGSSGNWGGEPSVVAGQDYMVLVGTFITEIVSLTDPKEPELIAEIPLWTQSALLANDLLILVSEGNLHPWDLSDPSNPADLPVLKNPFGEAPRVVKGPGLDEAVFFYRSGHGLQINYEDTDAPETGNVIRLTPSSSVVNVTAIPPGVVALDRFASLELYDSNLNHVALNQPDLASQRITRLAARSDGLALALGKKWYVVDWEKLQPRIVGTLSSDGMPAVRALRLEDSDAWAVGSSSITKLDLSNPSSPVIAQQDEREELNFAGAVAFTDDHLYVGDRNGLYVYQVEADTAPTLVGEYFGCSLVRQIEVSGALAVIACRNSGNNWQFLDVSIPETPIFLSEHPREQSFDGRSVVLEDKRAWLGFRDFVDLVDLEHPESPFLIARFHVPGRAFDLALAPAGVWVAAENGGVARLEAPDPITPGQTAAWYDPERAGEGWVVEVLDDDQVLGYWYTYDHEGNPRWLIGTGTRRDNRVVLEMQEAAGGRFGDEFDPDEVAFSAAGTVRMKFTGCDVGWFHYEFEDHSLDIGLDRLTRTLELGECRLDQQPLSQAPANHSGSWYDPAWAGQGFSVHRLGNGLAMVYWFTFDAEGEPYWIFGVGEDDDGRIVIDELTAARGASFGEEFDPDDVEMFAWGELEMELDCLTGTAEYRSDIDQFGSGRFDLERLTIPAGLSCD